MPRRSNTRQPVLQRRRAEIDYRRKTGDPSLLQADNTVASDMGVGGVVQGGLQGVIAASIFSCDSPTPSVAAAGRRAETSMWGCLFG
jgi:hypothetical protein